MCDVCVLILIIENIWELNTRYDEWDNRLRQETVLVLRTSSRNPVEGKFSWPNLTYVRLFRLQDLLSKLQWDEQERLINSTINLDIVVKYPLDVAYQKSFIKYILKHLEEECVEVHDVVFEAYGRLVSLVEQDDCHKHFLVCGEEVISIKEKKSIVSEGTTGLCVWQVFPRVRSRSLKFVDFLRFRDPLFYRNGVWPIETELKIRIYLNLVLVLV